MSLLTAFVALGVSLIILIAFKIYSAVKGVNSVLRVFLGKVGWMIWLVLFGYASVILVLKLSIELGGYLK